MNLDLELSKKFKKNISHNVKLSNYSWFNLGGPAEHLFKPNSKEQLIQLLHNEDFEEHELGAKASCEGGL